LMSIPLRLGFGGKIGQGNQWMSWIHIDDCVNLLAYCLTNEQMVGPVNITAPQPESNDRFMKTAASCLKRPSLITTPRFLVQTILGDMSQLITNGQFVLPQKALNKGFNFKYPTLVKALEDLYNRK